MNKDKRKFVCFDVSQRAQIKIDNLSSGPRHIVLWQMELFAELKLKEYGSKWNEHLRDTGIWVFKTTDQVIHLEWRFDGIEDSLPIFHIGHVTIQKREDLLPKKPEKEKTKIHKKILLLTLTIAALSLFFEELENLLKTIPFTLELMFTLLSGLAIFLSKL